jgi:dihydrolipoamide dehydrogenase
MNKGVQYLMKKNKVDVHMGSARFLTPNQIAVSPSTDMDGNNVGDSVSLSADHIIIATGARAREIPPLPVDGQVVITYKEAMLQRKRPNRMVIVGAGAIGVEFAYFYHNMGTDVTLVEVQDRIVPVEDADVSRELSRSFKKRGINVMTSAQVEGVDMSGSGAVVRVKTAAGMKEIETDQVLSAVGVRGNIEDLGLETIGVATEPGRIVIDDFGRTNIPGVYAIGDVAGGPWLAHKASHEGILCVEAIAGLSVSPMDRNNIPGCTYCQPQIASTGYTEEAAKKAGFDLKVGKFPFTASGKASAIGHTEGFVKVIYDAKYGEMLGCHIIGAEATEMIAEAVTARTLETTAHEIMETIHPHPTLSEAIMEATRAAYGIPINI